MSAILKTLIKSSEATAQPCPLIDFQMKKNAHQMKYICVTNPFLYSVVKTYVVSLN